MSDATERHKALVRAVTEEIWNGRRFDRIPDFYAPDYTADYRPYAPLRHGHEAVRSMVEKAWEAFPDYHEEILALVAEGSRVVVHLAISGTQSGPWGVLPPSGRRVRFEEMLILELRGGRIAGQRGIADNLAALRQLGVIPTPPT